jgi:rhodanese-related sulfurtransferase
MKKVVVLTLIAVVALGATLGAAPKIAVDNAVYDFGTVLEGVFVTHKFILSNVGDETLTITSVRTSCGCTTTALSKTTLASGESVELGVNLDTAGYGGRSPTWNVYVESNDPSTPRLILRILGTVVRLQPYHIAISDFLMGAINIPLAELGDWVSRLPQGVLIILYDQDGTQSDLAAQVLNDKGFPDAKSLMGGFDEWMNVYKDKFTISTADD